MPKVMLINVTHSEESRVGIMNDGVLESFEIESVTRSHLKGNIYKGVVHRIHPALEAAFVDIGAERDAFLPLDEICFNNLDESAKASSRSNGSEGGRSRPRIRDVLRPGQDLLVQIAKEQFANKPPTLTTFYSLPGRYLVLLPGSEDTGISRRIEGEERDRLRKLVDALKPEEGFGLIVRTVAGLEENGNDLPRDLEYLKRLWANVQSSAKTQPAPSLVYREHDIVQRAIRDFYTPDITEIYIDDEDVYQRAREFLHGIMPGSEAVLRVYRGEQPLFSAFKVEEQIESVFGRRVRLPSGGSIVIDGTEALTAIDVNSGGAVRSANPEETAFRTNCEAAREVSRQLRLRDIGGIIVVDFIDMRDSRHIREIEQLVRNEMRTDKARHETSRLSSLGLMQISRQRLRPAAGSTSHVTCPLCQGYGSVRTHASAALGAIRKIHNRLSLGDVETMTVTLPTEVGLCVLNQSREDLANLESRYESTVEIKLSSHLLPHEFETEVKERSRAKAPVKAVEPGEVAARKEPKRGTEARDGAARHEPKRDGEARDGAARHEPKRGGEAVEGAARPEPKKPSENGEVTATPSSERAGESSDGTKRRRRRRKRRGEPRTSAENGASVAGQGTPTAPMTTARAESGAPSRIERETHLPAERPATVVADETVAATAESGNQQEPGSPAQPVATGSTGDQAAGGTDGDQPSRSRRSRGRRGGRRHRPGSRPGQPATGEASAPTGESRALAESRSGSQSHSQAPTERSADRAAAAPSVAAPSATSMPPETTATATPAVVAPQATPATPATTPAAAAKHAPRKTSDASAGDEATVAKPKRAAAKKTTAKKTTTKKAAAKKATAKKTTKKAAAKKTTAKKRSTAAGTAATDSDPS